MPRKRKEEEIITKEDKKIIGQISQILVRENQITREEYIRVQVRDGQGRYACSNAYEMRGTVPVLRTYDMLGS